MGGGEAPRLKPTAENFAKARGSGAPVSYTDDKSRATAEVKAKENSQSAFRQDFFGRVCLNAMPDSSQSKLPNGKGGRGNPVLMMACSDDVLKHQITCTSTIARETEVLGCSLVKGTIKKLTAPHMVRRGATTVEVYRPDLGKFHFVLTVRPYEVLNWGKMLCDYQVGDVFIRSPEDGRTPVRPEDLRDGAMAEVNAEAADFNFAKDFMIGECPKAADGSTPVICKEVLTTCPAILRPASAAPKGKKKAKKS